MKFEEAMEKLQEIVHHLEAGNLPLEESLQKFEEGIKLIDFCEKKLNEVEKKIQVLTKEDGKFKLEEWQEKEKKPNSLPSEDQEEKNLLF